MNQPAPTVEDPATDVATRRAAWTAALRSGRYPQGTGCLRSAAGYCCLGVAEDVRGATWRELTADEVAQSDQPASHVVVVYDRDVYDRDDYNDDDDDFYLDAELVLSNAAMAYYGLAVNNPDVVFRDPARDGRWAVAQLSQLNDEYDLSLAQIADVIDDQHADWTGDGTMVDADARRRRIADGETSDEAYEDLRR